MQELYRVWNNNGRVGPKQSGYNPSAKMKIIHTRRKTIALIIEPDGSLTVRAPLRFSRIKIDQLVTEKADWIRERQEWVRQHTISPHYYEAGELFYFQGKSYPLLLHGSPTTAISH